MRKWSLITAILLALSAWVVAQSNSAPPAYPNSQQSTSQQPDAQQQKEPIGTNHHAHSIEGCITRGATGYTLTDNAGKTYQLAGDTSQLAAEDGHWDRVTGSEEANAPGAASAAGAPTAFTVTKVKVVQTTCPTK